MDLITGRGESAGGADAREQWERLLEEMPVEAGTWTYNALLHGYAQLWATGDDERVSAAPHDLAAECRAAIRPARP